MAFYRYRELDTLQNSEESEMKCYELYKDFVSKNFNINSSIFQQTVKEILGPIKILSCAELIKTEDESLHCACIIQSAIYDTSLIVERFSEFLKEIPKVVNDFTSRSEIKVCCFGAGPAVEAVAISSVIDKLLILYGFSDSSKTAINLMHVVTDDCWNHVNKSLIEMANKHFKKVQLNVHFYVTNLTNPFPKKLQQLLKRSLIVTMVKSLSWQSSTKKKINIIQNMVTNMRKNAILFFLDVENQNYKTLSETGIKFIPFTEVYFSPASNIFNLKKKTYSAESTSDFDRLSALVNNSVEPTICSTWIKAHVKKKYKSTFNEEVFVNVKTSTGLPSKKIRNSTGKLKLVGKFASMDLEKKNKDDSHRREAREVNSIRYASFDDDY